MSNTSPVVRLKAFGNIVTQKNHKMLSRGRLITDPKKQAIAKAITEGFVSQFLCGSATEGAGILTEAQRLSLTALWPRDDCWTCVPELHVTARLVPKGQEGADITIEQLI